MGIEEIKDRMALRELADRVSLLADQKDFAAQVQLFTEDAVSETYSAGNLLLALQGREQMASAFADYLKDVETLFHMNGQHIVTIEEDGATGTSYCSITMVTPSGGHKVKTEILAIYNDTYARKGDGWQIAKRIGNFILQENIRISQ